MKPIDEVIKALEVCGNDEPIKCPMFNSEEWRCCDWEGERKIHRKRIADDALFYLKEYREMKEHLACLDSHTLHGDETERRYDNGNLERY
jgi:hypothetical protein